MDAFLRVTDSIHDMFSEVREGVDPTPADPELIETLKRFLAGDDGPEQAASPESRPEPVIETSAATASSAGDDEITDDEFESLLDQLHGDATPTAVKSDTSKASGSAAATNNDSNDEITDDEFESLLDKLHGDGAPKAVEAETPVVANKTPVSAGDGLMTDGEFENLLDELHGKGGMTKVDAPTESASVAKKERQSSR